MIIETERLLLRPFKPTDRTPFAELNGDRETLRYFPNPLSRAESDTLIDRIEDKRTETGLCFLAAELKADGTLAGMIGLSHFDEIFRNAIPGNPDVEVGWRLRRDLWGRGLAPEGAKACLAYGWKELNLPEIVAITYQGNQPSRRVMEKIGMAYASEADFPHPKIAPDHFLSPHVLYRIDNPAYSSRTPT